MRPPERGIPAGPRWCGWLAPCARRVGIFALLAFLLTGTGCAYYNTFYLARKYYNLGVNAEKKNTTGRLAPEATTQFDKAIKQAEKILTRYPNSKWVDDALFLMGRAHFGREDYSAARQRFEELLTRLPDSEFAAQARFWIGRTHFAGNDYVKAAEVFEELEAAGLDPAWGDDVVYFLGEISFAQEDYSGAVERYRDLIERYPNGRRASDALGRIGDALFARRQYAEARESYDAAIVRTADARDRFDLRLKIGQCLEKQQRFDEALNIYRETAYELVPPDKFTRIMADPEAADRSALDQIVRDQGGQQRTQEYNADDPPPPNAGTVDAQKTLQEQQLRAQLGEGNRRAAAEAVASNPLASQLPRILLRQGLCNSAAGDQKAAISTFRAVITAFPRTSEAGEAQFRIGYIQEVEFQDYEAARKSYDEVKQQGSSLFTEQSTRRAAGLNRLITLAAADTAKGAARKSLEAEAERAFLSAELFLFQQEKPGKALEQYERVETDYPTSTFAAKSALARAWILGRTLGDTAQAAQVYRDIVTKYPGTEPWRQAYQIVRGEAPPEAPKPPPDTLAAGLGATAPEDSVPPETSPLALVPPAQPPAPAATPGSDARPPSLPIAPGATPPGVPDVAAARTVSPALGANSSAPPAEAGSAPRIEPAGGAIVPGVPRRMPSRVAPKSAAGLPKSWVEWQRALERAKSRGPAPVISPPGSAAGPPAKPAAAKPGAGTKPPKGAKRGGGRP